VYWGAAEPLGQALVLPSVKRLAGLGARVTLVTFDKPEDLACEEHVDLIRRDLEAHGIRWVSLRYHKSPQAAAKVYDALAGWIGSIVAHLQERTSVVHARTFVGGLIGSVLATLLRTRFIYHNEGFYPDEQVDGGIWAVESGRHRIARKLEARLYSRADGIIVLSHRAKAVIEDIPAVGQRRTPVIVVPSAVDLERFTVRGETRAHSGNALRLLYSGSIGGRYRFDDAVRFAAVARQEVGRVHLRVVTRTEHHVVETSLATSGLPRATWSVDSRPHAEMPDELPSHDAGLYFLTRGLSEHACSPTRIGEYWACGLPVVVSPNVSDTEDIIRRERVGVVLRERSEAGYSEGVRSLTKLIEDPEVNLRCRRAAERHYALGPACDRQMALYETLLS
jgi:glycosyltransferase involved in cell wall biosynthesis